MARRWGWRPPLAVRKAAVPLVVALAVALGPRAALEARVGLGPRVMRCA